MNLESSTTASSSSPKEWATYCRSSSSSECSITCNRCSKGTWDRWASSPRLCGQRQEPVCRHISRDFFRGLLFSPPLLMPQQHLLPIRHSPRTYKVSGSLILSPIKCILPSCPLPSTTVSAPPFQPISEDAASAFSTSCSSTDQFPTSLDGHCPDCQPHETRAFCQPSPESNALTAC